MFEVGWEPVADTLSQVSHFVFVVLTAWLAVAALMVGMRMGLVGIRRPPYPDRVRVPFEIIHAAVAGLGGGLVCARRGGETALACALVLGVSAAALELVSVRVGWTSFDKAHAFATNVVTPVALAAGAIFFR